MGAYETVKREMGRLPWPVYYIPGNHDNRDAMHRAQLLPEDHRQASCRRVDFPQASIILLDTVLQGQSRGGVSDETLALLADCLTPDGGKPTFLFMHHVPFCTGYTVMDEPFEQVEKLTALLAGRQNLYVCCGHIHGSMATRIEQTSVITCPPCCMDMEFDLTSRGGDMFYTAEPQFAMHTVEGLQVITHFVAIPTGEVRTGPYTFSV